MKNYTFYTLLIIIGLCSKQVQAANFSSSSTGNWNNAGTWIVLPLTDDDGIPDADDNVTIAANHIITLDVAPTILSLIMSNGTLTGANSLTILNNMTLSNMTLTNGQFIPNGTVTIGGNLIITDNGQFIPNGTVTIGGNLTITDNGQFIPNGTVTIVGNLTITGGLFNPNAAVTIGGNLVCTDGQIGSFSGSTTVSTINIAGTTTFNNVILTENEITKKILNLNGGGTITGSVHMFISAIINIPAGQTLLISPDISTGRLMIANTTTKINLIGNLIKQGTPTFRIYSSLDNTGNVTVSEGILALNGSGTHSGTFVTNANEGLQFGESTDEGFSSGSIQNLTGPSITGTGSWVIGGGSGSNPDIITLSNPIIRPLKMKGGRLRGNINTTITEGDLTIQVGAFFEPVGTVTLTNNLNLSGTFANIGNATIAGNINKIGTGAGSIGNPSVLTLGIVTVAGSTTFGGIYGKTVIANGGASVGGAILMARNGILRIPVGQTLTLNGGAWITGIDGDNSSSVELFGTAIMGGTGDVIFNTGIRLINNGVLDVATNKLSLQYAYSGQGQIKVASGATLAVLTSNNTTINYENALLPFVNNGTITGKPITFSTFTASVTLEGNGSFSEVTIQGSSPNVLTITGAPTFTKLNMGSGKMAIANNLTINNNIDLGGKIQGSGNLTFGGNLTLSNSTSSITTTGNVTVAGNLTVSHAASSLTPTGNVTVTGNLSLTSGTFSNVGNVSINGTTTQSDGTFAPTTATLTGNTSISGGICAPIGNATLSILAWSGGTIGSTSADPNTNVTINGLATLNGNTKTLIAKKLLLNGGGNWTEGVLIIDNGSTLEVPLSKTLVANTNGALEMYHLVTTDSHVDIKGTLDKQGTGTLEVTTLDNSGLIRATSGKLVIKDGGTNTGTIENNSHIQFQGNYTLETYSGAGQLTVERVLTVNTVGGINYTHNLLTNFGSIDNNPINMNGIIQQTLGGRGHISTLTLNNANDLIVTGQSVSSLHITNGKIQLTDSDFIVDNFTVTGDFKDHYVRTNGTTGRLVRGVGTSEVLFPIGESTYAPVRIVHNGPEVAYSVRVSDGIDVDHPLMGTAFVGKEWNISRPASITPAFSLPEDPATIKTQWNAADEGLGFTAASARLLHYDQSLAQWEVLPSANRTVSCALGICTLTQTDVIKFSPFAIGLPSTVLAAELLDFQAFNKDKLVQLAWKTATETHFSHFDIERSADSKIFEKIGQTKAKGNNSTYNFDDNGPLSILTYYRLKMIDTDGKFKYSKVLSVERSKGSSIRVFPNPVQNELSIDIHSDAKKIDVEVFDILGRSIFKQNTEGSNLLTINTLKWQSGVYMLMVTDGAKTFQQKIIKQ